MTSARQIIALVAQRQDIEQFHKKNWVGTFENYLDLVRSSPTVTRNAFERVYDMIMSFGTYTVEGAKKEGLVRFKFFDDPESGGRDASFRLDCRALGTVQRALRFVSSPSSMPASGKPSLSASRSTSASPKSATPINWTTARTSMMTSRLTTSPPGACRWSPRRADRRPGAGGRPRRGH